MDSEIYILDGYNLLRRGFQFEGAGRDLETQRGMLEVLLKEFVRKTGNVRIVLVYDGALDVSIPHRGERIAHSEGEIEVLFSEPPETADDVILRECRNRRTRGAPTVVTSDLKDIGRNLDRLGVQHRTSEQFALFLEDVFSLKRTVPLSSPEQTLEKPATVSPEEAQEWLQVFSKPRPKRRRGKRRRR